MIHTAEIAKNFPSPQMRNAMSAFRFSEQEIFRVTDFSNFDRSDSVSHIITDPNVPYFGLTQITAIRAMDYRGFPHFQIKLRINPLGMMIRKSSIGLFKSDYPPTITVRVNVIKLVFKYTIEAFDRGRHKDIVRSLQLDDLETWKCLRVDFAVNLNFDSDYLIFSDPQVKDSVTQPAKRFDLSKLLKKEQAVEGRNPALEIFYRLSTATALPKRKYKKYFHDKKKYEQSVANGNDSIKVICYKKFEEIVAHNVLHRVDAEQKEYEQSAVNIIRFEVQCHKGKIRTLKKKWNLPNDASLIDFCQPEKVYELLMEEYEELIGVGNFFLFTTAKKLLMLLIMI